jgi:outer membrane murein-binding lipoprotein Lpp
MNIDLTALGISALPKLAAAGLLAVAASVVTTYTLRSDIQHLTAAVAELRSEVRQIRADLYVPRSSDPKH